MLFVLVEVVEVDVVWTAAFSALVSFGGVMLGVLLGTASETLLLPHAPRVNPSTATQAATAARLESVLEMPKTGSSRRRWRPVGLNGSLPVCPSGFNRRSSPASAGPSAVRRWGSR